MGINLCGCNNDPGPSSEKNLVNNFINKFNFRQIITIPLNTINQKKFTKKIKIQFFLQ